MSRLPILNFHGVQAFESEYHWSSGEQTYVTSKDMFERELSLIEEKGFKSLSLNELASWRSESDSGKRIMLTFDDGHISHFKYVALALQKKRLKGIFFVPPGLIGKTGQMRFTEIQELHKQGFDIGAHGLNHVPLPDLSELNLYYELNTSKKMLEDKLSAAVVSFSVPRGFYSSRVREMAIKVGYQFVFTSDFDLNRRDEDVFALKRLVVKSNTSLESFTDLIEGRLGHKKYVEFAKTKVRGLLGPAGYEVLAEAKCFLARNQVTFAGRREGRE